MTHFQRMMPGKPRCCECLAQHRMASQYTTNGSQSSCNVAAVSTVISIYCTDLSLLLVPTPTVCAGPFRSSRPGLRVKTLQKPSMQRTSQLRIKPTSEVIT